MHRPKSVGLWLITLALCSWCPWRAGAEDKVALLIDASLYGQVEGRLARYEWAVEMRLPVDLQFHVNPFASSTPEAIRIYIQHEYNTNGISGVILVGQIPYALWRQGVGNNEGILSFFYEDLDGTFADTNGDGVYDWHEWGTHDGPEIWACWMRPPVMDEAGYLNALLDEADAYYTGQHVTTKRGLVACHEDYDNNFWPDGSTIPSMPALVDIYGLENVDTDGEEADLVVASELLAMMLNGDYEIVHQWSHAWPGGQAWDVGPTTSTDLMTTAPRTGPLIAHIYGCHSGDFINNEGTSIANTCIAVAYAFGPGAGQAATGTSWSYGTEGMNYITEAMRDGAYLGQGYKHLLDIRENSAAIHERYPDRDIHTELSGNNLFGNPFLYANWTGFPDLVGDLDGDCDVDLADLAQLLAHYGMTEGAIYQDGDLDGDGDVDLADLAELISHYREVCP